MLTLPKSRPRDSRTYAERQTSARNPKPVCRVLRLPSGGVQWNLIQSPDILVDTGWAATKSKARADAGQARRDWIAQQQRAAIRPGGSSHSTPTP